MYIDGPVRLWAGQLWVGYAMGSLLEGNVKVYCRQQERVYLGGVYFHKHERYQTRQDFEPLKMLDAIKPLEVPQVCLIEIDRDIANIDTFPFAPAISAWDCELLLALETYPFRQKSLTASKGRPVTMLPPSPIVQLRYYDPTAWPPRADIWAFNVHAGGGPYTYIVYLNDFPYQQVGIGYNPGEFFVPLPPGTGVHSLYLAELYMAQPTGIRSNTILVDTEIW